MLVLDEIVDFDSDLSLIIEKWIFYYVVIEEMYDVEKFDIDVSKEN